MCGCVLVGSDRVSARRWIHFWTQSDTCRLSDAVVACYTVAAPEPAPEPVAEPAAEPVIEPVPELSAEEGSPVRIGEPQELPLALEEGSLEAAREPTLQDTSTASAEGRVAGKTS
ncbi:hypothetical protein HPB50_028902 [Hyalomma asiaticum]|nr:hypothetical protein HPB50_028902 [Hyalomma asiaticum]